MKTTTSELSVLNISRFHHASERVFLGLVFIFCFHFWGVNQAQAQCSAAATVFYLTNTAASATTNPGDEMITTNTGANEGIPPGDTAVISATPIYWYSPVFSGVYNASTPGINYVLNLWMEPVASPSMVTVQFGYSNPNGTGQVLLGSSTQDASVGGGNHITQFYISSTVSGLSLNNQVFWISVTQTSGNPATAIFNDGLDFGSDLIVPPGQTAACPTQTPLPCGYTQQIETSGTSDWALHDTTQAQANPAGWETLPFSPAANGFTNSVVWTDPTGSGIPGVPWLSYNAAGNGPSPPDKTLILHYFTIPVGATNITGTLYIAVDDNEDSWINGNNIYTDPSPTTDITSQGVSTYTVASADFQGGTNVLAIEDNNSQPTEEGYTFELVLNYVEPCGTPTNTPTMTLTSTITLTPTLTATNSATNSPTGTSTSSPTASCTNTATQTATNTLANTGTFTNTPTNTATNTATQTVTNTATTTPTTTPPDTATFSMTATFTATNTITNTVTNTFSPTITYTPTTTPTNSFTSTVTNTPTVTFTSTSSNTSTQTFTPTQTYTFTVTPTPTSFIGFGKTVSETQANAGDVLTYTIGVTVTGAAGLTNPVVTDTLPTNMTFQSFGTVPSGTITFFNASTDQLQWILPTSLTAGVYDLTYQTKVFAFAQANVPLTNHAQLTYAGLITPMTVSVPVTVIGQFTVSVNIYNSAGEVVKTIPIQQFSSAINNIVLSTTNTINTLMGTGSTIEILYNGYVIGSWNGTNNLNQPVSNGTYRVQVDNVSTTGLVTSVSQNAIVSRSLSQVEVDIYNGAGELVRTLYNSFANPTTSSMTNVLLSSTVLQPNTNNASTGVASQLQIWVQDTNQPVTLIWDGSNNNGTYVNSGQYEIQVHWTNGSGNTTDITRTVLVIPTAGVGGIAVARPNILNAVNGMTTVFDTSGVTNASSLKVKIYTIAGELARSLASGSPTVNWNASGMASGIYIAVVEIDNASGGIVNQQRLKILVLH